MISKSISEMTDEEFRDYLNYTKEGKEIKSKVMDAYCSKKKKKIKTIKTRSKKSSLD